VTSLGAGRAGSVEPVDELPPAAALAPVPARLGEAERGPMHLDSISKAIIEQLQQDGRRSYAKIAAAVGLSEAAVRQRVARLTEAGVMQIVAVTNPLQLGFRRQAMLGIKAEGRLEPIIAALSAKPEVDYVVVTAGAYDLLAEVVCEDDDHLLSLLENEIRTIPGVRTTESFLYLKLSKQTYQWGTR
jgi:Lrp/AsnC family transcriptional regulator for asnA, asnC and gidA